MKDVIQKEYKALKLFGIKILEFNTITTIDGKNEIKMPKREVVTDKDYEILAKFKQKYINQDNNQELVEDNKRWWQE